MCEVLTWILEGAVKREQARGLSGLGDRGALLGDDLGLSLGKKRVLSASVLHCLGVACVGISQA